MIFADEIASSRFVRYDGRQEIVLPAMDRFRRRTAFFVALALMLAGAGWFLGGRELVASARTRIAIERLTEASPQRLPEARFTALQTGVRTQAATAMRGGDDDLAFKARVADVVRLSSSAPDPVRRGASAVALVMEGAWSSALTSLEKAVVEYPQDAGLWSDLAAARYERSVALDDSAGLLPALVAADRSRRVDPSNANALFNRALILERLGLRTVAPDAWRACLDVEKDPAVSMEARRRLEVSESEDWLTAQPELERAVERGDVSSVAQLVATYPYDARTYSEVIYLTKWANAYLAGDRATAAKNLKIARMVGEALRPRGESLLAEAVEAIDGAAAEPALHTLATAQQAYDRGRDALSEERYVDGEALFEEAARGFAQEHSPMAFVARVYEAFVVERTRASEAQSTLGSIAAELRSHRGYRSLLALTLWTEGRGEILRGRWNEGVNTLRESQTIFTELGETKNAGAVDNILAETYERLGRPDLAWPHCLAALRRVSDKKNLYRLQVAVAGAVRMAISEQSWHLAASLLDVELSVASQLRKPYFNADAFRRLYIVENERKEFASRDIALTRARIAAAHAGEESQRQLAEIDQTEALVTMQRNPDRAVTLFTRALEFAATNEQRISMADLLWHRGRAHLAAGEKAAASADFMAGIEELEKQRGDIATTELRARFFDASEGLFDDAVGLLADGGDAAAAFQYADRAKARALLEIDESAAVPAPVVTPAALAERLPDAALVEFAVLDRDVFVFCIRNSQVRMHRLPIAAEALREKIEQLRRSIARAPVEHVRVVSAELYELLFGAVDDVIATAETVVIVPDDDLQRVPFAALWRRSANQYLAQSHAIAIAPSAAVISTRTSPRRQQREVLLIGNAAGNEEESLDYLPNVNEEIAGLRRIYRSSRVLFGTEASKARFISEVGAYDVVHFAGHGLSDEESLTASLLLARNGNDSGRLYTSDIAALRLPREPLVVLAACGTLRGRVGGVEGMPSLARSFLAAGASTVIGTLWDTDDARSVPLLTSFHRSIAANASPATALREAQREAIARGGHPRNWAPYVVYTATP